MSLFQEMVRRVPIEWLVLIVPYTVAAIISATVLPFPVHTLFYTYSIVDAIFNGFFGIFFVVLIFFLVLWWCSQKLFVLYPQLFGRPSTSSVNTMQSGWSVLMVLTIPYLCLCMMVLLSALFTAVELEAVQRFSLLYTDWDQFVFGPLIYAELIAIVGQSPLFTAVVVYAYQMLVLVTGVTCVIVTAHSIGLFRKYVLAFFLAFLFSMPLWLLLPAVSPTHYLLERVLGAAVAPQHQALQRELEDLVGSATEAYKEVYGGLVAQWGGATYASQSQYAVSTNPSMHVAYGWVCVFYLFYVNRWLGIVSVVYQLLNIAGTVLLLQHYTIDILTGTAVAILAIVVTNAVLRYEARMRTYDEKKWFAPLILFKSMIDSVREHVRNNLALNK